MVDRVAIIKITNGYIIDTYWSGTAPTNNASYHEDMKAVIKHLETCFSGKVDKHNKPEKE